MLFLKNIRLRKKTWLGKSQQENRCADLADLVVKHFSREQIILTTYFTGKRDPQRGGGNQYKPDKYENMKGWYDSLIAHHLNGIIFHDQLSKDFIDRYTNDHVHFEEYKLKKVYSLNDDRFFCWCEWLEQHEEAEAVFCTDLFDVDFLGNPFSLMDPPKYDLYCGDDGGAEINDYVKTRMRWAYGKAFHVDKIKFNAGTIGGTRENVLRLFQNMIHDFEHAKRAKRKRQNVNMGVFNKCVHDLFDESRIMYGSPLNSRFKQYEKEGNFCIRHK